MSGLPTLTLDEKIAHWRSIGVGSAERTYEHFETFCRVHLRVRAKVGRRWQWVGLELGEEQEHLARLILADLAAGRPVRIIVLKCRKLGISTLIQALGYWFGALDAGWVTQVVAHQAQATATIANIARSFASHMYPFAARRLGARRFGPGLVWDNGSKLEVFTQRSDDAARGSSPSLLHLSEVAFWDKGRAKSTAEDTMVALMAAIEEGSESWDALDGSGDDADAAFDVAEQAGAGTIVIIESTANGAAGSFHSRWIASQQPDGPWRGVFFGWHQARKYRFPERSKADADCTREAHDAIAREDKPAARAVFESLGFPAPWPERAAEFGLSVAQVRWAIRKLADLGGNLAMFDQEFPLSSDMAFAATGRRVWTDEEVSAHPVRAPIWTSGPLGPLQAKGTPEERLRAASSPGDCIRVWEWPEPTWTHRYAAGSDVAGGAGGGDSTTCIVADRVTSRQVAELITNKLPPDIAADQVARLCEAFGTATVCWEANNHGNVLGNELANRIRYRALWKRHPGAPSQSSDPAAWIRDYGYLTNENSRAAMTTRITTALRTRSLVVVSDRVTAEMRTWVHDEHGRPDHVAGKYDDTLIGTALSLYASDQMPEPLCKTKPRRDPNVWDEDEDDNRMGASPWAY